VRESARSAFVTSIVDAAEAKQSYGVAVSRDRSDRPLWLRTPIDDAAVQDGQASRERDGAPQSRHSRPQTEGGFLPPDSGSPQPVNIGFAGQSGSERSSSVSFESR
jgi:hypothetical protein